VLAVGLAGCATAPKTSFDTAAVGTLPPGWLAQITGPGEPKWSIDKDDSFPGRPLVLKQSAWTPKPSYPLCVKPGVSLKDGFVEVKFKPLSGTNDQAAGVVWRYWDTNNYYVLRANALEDNVVLYKVEQGKRKALDIVGRVGGYGVKQEVPGQQWSTLRVQFQGPRFRAFLNGKELFAVEDATFPEAGAVGVWTKADSVTLFGDFRYGVQTR
jgi:hypothetical protein